MKRQDSITITDLDLARLGHLKDAGLAPELDRADIVPFHAVPPNVVTMNSRVAFEDETTGEFRIVTIVYPHEADSSEGKISVIAPRGRPPVNPSTSAIPVERVSGAVFS